MTDSVQAAEAAKIAPLPPTARHYEEGALIPASVRQVFDYVDDHARLSAHMGRSSWMMGGGRMDFQIDGGGGVGSHLRLSGTVLGMRLSVDEVVTHYVPPYRKAWQTVGTPRLLVIGHYRMGVEIHPERRGSTLSVWIDYEPPATRSTRWLGVLLGRIYARWCVRQMIQSAQGAFRVDDRN